MFIIYDSIFLLFVIFYLPVFLFKKKLHPGFCMRLGMLPKAVRLERPIWIHAVSVGEAMAIRGLAAQLRQAYPHSPLIISTVTHTGNKIARGIAKENDLVVYLPLDFSFIIRGVIDRINPAMFILTETELWPNLISYLKRRNIPIAVVNGRISDKSFIGYRSIKFLIKPVLNKISLFCVQTQRDAERLSALGVREDRIRVTGNMKFDASTSPDIPRGSLSINGERSRTIDATDRSDFRNDYADYKIKLGLKPQDKLLVAGSTHPGEEEIVLGVYKRLLVEFINLRLLIAPRHPERTKDIERAVIKYGFNPSRISRLGGLLANQVNRQTVFILDTVGQLISFYAIADIVFVGGSLIRKGGHNILEPAWLGKPVLIGPYMFNFQDITGLFLENQACLLVHNEEGLEIGIRDLLNSPSLAEGMGRKAKDLIRQNQGATGRTVLLLQELRRR